MSKASSHSSLALPFDEALRPSRFLTQVKLSSENQLRSEIAKHGNAVLAAAVVGAKISYEAGTVRVVFEKGIPAGAKLMKSAGRTMPVLVDGKTGQIRSLGSVVSKGRAAGSFAASSALVVVQVAHMISGYDNAQRLKKVESGVDLLVHAHHSELKSRMEAIYRHSKELLHHGLGSLTPEDRRDLHRQCRDLMELRARWREEFKYRLGKVDPAAPGFWASILWWRREDAREQDMRRKADESRAALEFVELMHFSLMLQMALAGSAGRIEEFRGATLPDECESWRSLATFGRTRAREIAGRPEAQEFENFLTSLDDVAAYWTPWGAAEPLPLAAAPRRKAVQNPMKAILASKRSTLYDKPVTRRVT